jgi:DNA-binding GntR family transcriptional regulator
VGVVIGRQSGTIYSFIENMYGVRIDQVDQSLFVVTMPPAAADGLAVDHGSQAIVLRRVYRLADGTVPLVAVNYHVPDRLTLNWTLHRTGA